MPSYSFRDTNTGEEFELFMKMSEREDYLRENPHIKQIITKAPAYGDPVHLGARKPDGGFKEVMQKIKSSHPLGTINHT